jgi:hypothetical protein
MNVLQEILLWSEAQPLWQRDALRRLVRGEGLNDGDFTALTKLCKQPHGLLSEEHSQASPLGKDDAPSLGDQSAVVLGSLSQLENVNALAPDQTLTFSPGLTVVYGENAAGKSGYARVLKSACRARGRGEKILPNVLSVSAVGTPAALISYRVNDDPLTATWRDGEPVPAELGNVSVFDTAAAQVYVAERTDVAFRPFGLDLFDKLVVACDEVRGRLEAEQSALDGAAASFPSLGAGTASARFLSGLTALTTSEEIDRVTQFTAEDAEALQRLRSQSAAFLEEEPQRKASGERLRCGRYQRLAKHLREVAHVLSAENVQRLETLRGEVLAAEGACAVARSSLTGVHLSEVGGAVWKVLWDAARQYSEQVAYPAREFPITDAGSRCVLCQSVLEPEAAARLRRIDQFIRQEVQDRVQVARASFEAERAKAIELEPLGIQTVETLAELELQHLATGSLVRSYLERALQWTQSLSTALSTGEHPAPMTDVCPAASVDAAAEAADNQSRWLQQAADPDARKDVAQRLAELEAKEPLSLLRGTIRSEVRRRQLIQAYDACIRDTGTSGITRKNSELTKAAVSDRLAAAFADELKRMRFRSIELELKAIRGDRGVFYHQIKLRHQSRAELPKIVSEGEGRCLALAAFLAELDIAEHKSAIVFDDPVSSLDHRWREQVALRLVEEARERQVIVLSHDIVFVTKLKDVAEKLGIAFLPQYVRREFQGPGVCGPELPWPAMKVKERIGHLRDLWQVAEKVYRLEGSARYLPLARNIYTLLRQAWERAFEEVLLAGSIERFSNEIHTKPAAALTDISSEDVEALDQGMSKCSDWMHDQPAAVNPPFPEPAELESDVLALKEWVRRIRVRRGGK